MLQELRSWLNGSREYYSGVALYEMLGDDPALLRIFKKGKTDFTTKKLPKTLLEICDALKEKKNHTSSDQSGSDECSASASLSRQHSETEIPYNKDLHEAALQEATHLYKEMMNERAVLFAMVNVPGYEDLNTAAQILERGKLAVNLVLKNQLVSKLYDDAAYIKQYGKRPEDSEPTNEYEAIPDHLVKDSLNNARKAYNKLKAKEQNTKRVARLQQHAENIQKLEARWRSLKPA